MERLTVVALAGQRIDPAGEARRRFPEAHTALVSGRIRDQLIALRAGTIVCSAACGADLLALAEAGALGMRRYVVLPFEITRFRSTSVSDCPGEWLASFDRVVKETGAAGDLEMLHHGGPEIEAYGEVNRRILTVAQSLAAVEGMPAVAVLVWDGTAAGPDSVTGAFADEARRRDMRVVEVSITGDAPSR